MGKLQEPGNGCDNKKADELNGGYRENTDGFIKAIFRILLTRCHHSDARNKNSL